MDRSNIKSKPAKRPPTFQEFLKSVNLSYPGVHTWGEMRSRVRTSGDEALIAARKLWRQYEILKRSK